MRCTVLVPMPSCRCYRLDPGASRPQLEHARLDVTANPGPAELDAGSLGPGEAAIDPFDDDFALELGEHAQHAKHGPPRWGGGVERLLVQEQANASAAELLHRAHDVLQRAAEAIDRPRGQQVVAASGGIL